MQQQVMVMKQQPVQPQPEDEGKEATSLLHSLRQDYLASKRCSAWLSGRKSKIALVVIAVLVIVMAVFAIVAVLTYKKVIYQPTLLQLCPTSNFVIIPLGTSGGITEDDLSSFLLTTSNSSYFIALDAGDIFTGMNLLTQRVLTMLSSQNKYSNVFSFPSWIQSTYQQAGWVMKNNIIGYFVGHPHLDHLIGLMAVAPEDGYMNRNGTNIAGLPKSIVGLNSTLTAIKEDLFNGIVWADFVSFGKYTFQTMDDGDVRSLTDILGNYSQSPTSSLDSFPNNVTVQSFLTCHDTLNSTAFLFTFSGTAQILFFSDTGVPTSAPPSFCDWTGRLATVWQAVNLNLLKAILIEVSFPNEVPDSGMFGHLRPKDLMAQLHVLAQLKNVKSLSGLTVIVEHIKPILGRFGSNNYQSDARDIIASELKSSNDLDVDFEFPVQGVQICV